MESRGSASNRSNDWRQESQRRGFTLVELLVVMAVIGVLVGLLLPSVQAVRESARRFSCLSRLAQIGMAVHAYESHMGRFPAGVVDSQKPIRQVPMGYHHNWISAILPYLDLPNAYRAIDPTKSVYDPVHDTLRMTPLPLLRCPSDPNSGPVSSYAGIHDSRERPIDDSDHGVFIRNQSFRIDDLSDGLSCTAWITEKQMLSVDLGWMSGTRGTLRNLGSLTRTQTFGGSFLVPGTNADQVIPKNLIRNETSVEELKDYAEKGFLEDLPNGPQGAIQVGGMGSAHSSGCHVALADGSVLFVGRSVSMPVLWALADRRDGLPLAPPEP
jgi:prepilin-type N-terminal cleavage/methylation domain-containing protein